MKKLMLVFMSAGLVLGMQGAFAATANKDARAKMTEQQKTAARDRGRAWCKKNYAGSGGAYVVRVEILSDGRVRCWFKS
jgi:hypothetical protein